MSNTIEARVISITGEEVYRLNGNTERGDILESVFNSEKIGGLLDCNLTLKRDSNVILFPGMRWEIYFKDDVFLDLKKIYTFYTEVLPTTESNAPTIEILGKGYYWKLKEQLWTESYTAETPANIINDLDFSETDLDLNEFDIALPSKPITVDFKDKNYIQVLDTLLKVLNEEYYTTQYYWGVDENRGLYFKEFPSTGTDVNKKFFEGYQFQNPSVEFSDKIVNTLEVFRATSADAKETEYVDTYENTESQDRYGKISSKLTVTDYLDTTSIESIANAILNRRSVAEKIIKLENFYISDSEVVEGNLIFNDVTDGISNWTFQTSATDTFNAVYRESVKSNVNFDRILPWDYYGISTKPQEKRVLINECDSLNGWTQSIAASVVAVSNENVFTGRQAFKWTRDADQVAGDYIEYELENIIQNPLEVCFSIYFKDSPANITFTFFDFDGNQIDIPIDNSNAALKDTWLTYCFKVPKTLVEETFTVNPTGSAEETFTVNPTGAAEETFTVNYAVNEDGEAFGAVINNIKKVRITLGTGSTNSDTIYIDRIDSINNAWTYSRLTLEKASYSVKRDFIIATLEFGDKKESLIDEIKNQVGKGNAAFDMYSKQ